MAISSFQKLALWQNQNNEEIANNKKNILMVTDAPPKQYFDKDLIIFAKYAYYRLLRRCWKSVGKISPPPWYRLIGLRYTDY